ncbi:MAG: 4Fe-4S dicluster domain-containing protein [Desulfovibrionaceae bacterium]|nr:4Fe-4S dicluster domain-containing protein [Desulfovibrionaceae bacterium]
MRFDNRAGEGGMILREEPVPAGRAVLLGVRPCDAKALAVLDGIFGRRASGDASGEVSGGAFGADPYWAARREATILCGLACNYPCPTCFCDQMGCGPHHREGLDALWTDLGESYLVTILTERGRELASDLAPAAQADLNRAESLKAEAASLLTGKFPMDKIAQRGVLELCELPLWAELAATCLNCGACTHVCPTCHCFDIQDEVKGERGRRLRNWDTCMSGLFTRHASGHNPRGDKLARVRQRFMHKFKYIPVKRGEAGCVGCGRCIKACPVNIDVREVVRAMNEQAPQTPEGAA